MKSKNRRFSEQIEIYGHDLRITPSFKNDEWKKSHNVENILTMSFKDKIDEQERGLSSLPSSNF